jgi:hypothetical protein
MIKQSTSWLLVTPLILMLVYAPAAAAAGSKAEKRAQQPEKVKAGIMRLGVGSEARVAVKLRDGRKVAGYIKEAGEDIFVIADLNTGASTIVP